MNKLHILHDLKSKLYFLIIVGIVHFLLSAVLLKQVSSYPVISTPQNSESSSVMKKLLAYSYRLAKIIKKNKKYENTKYGNIKYENKKYENIKYENKNGVLKKHHKHLKIFKEGYKFYKNGNYKKAAGLFWLYTDKKGKFLYNYSLYYQGVCFIKTHSYRKADFVLSRLVRDYPHFIFYKNAIFYIAKVMYKMGYYNDAAHNFKRLLKITEDNGIRPYSYEKIANIYLIKHNYKEAEAAIVKIYVNYPYYYKKHRIFNLLTKIKNVKKFGRYDEFNLTRNQKIKRAINLYYDSYFKESEQTIAKIKGTRAELIRLKDMLKLKSPQFLNKLAVFKSDIKTELKKFKAKSSKAELNLKLNSELKRKSKTELKAELNFGLKFKLNSKFKAEAKSSKAELNLKLNSELKRKSKTEAVSGYSEKRFGNKIKVKALQYGNNHLKTNSYGRNLSKYLHEANYLKADYFYLTANDNNAVRCLDKIFYKYGYLNKKETNIYQNVVWHRVLNNLKRNELVEAEKKLIQLIKVSSKSSNYPKYLFWYGIDLKKMGFAAHANFYFEMANAIAPLSYYGIMSGVELGHVLNFKKVHLNLSRLKLKNKISEKAHLNLSRLELKHFKKHLKLKNKINDLDYMDNKIENKLKIFLKLNLFSLAQYKLNEILRFNKIKDNKYFILKLVNLFNRYKDYRDAASLSDLLIKNKFLSRKYLYFLYPRPFYGYAEKYSEKYNVPVNLIYSIMRQESLFDPICSSGAGAIGLMQIISPTGYYIANKVGCTYFNPDYLYQSSLNIKFGSYYLSSLLNKFARKKYLAIASYNAGPGAVSYWKDNNLSDESKLLFIENIPYNQTRNYVKMVLRNYYVYNALYNK